ncbi:hypothetical protein GIB67_032741 [Kingdonia uniflora]|uniref:Uncharacterized protein n=2 Tax=Mesangiospermae TaxID=1437183 RepID=A0A7J7MWA8_9MAGN|nr:hypothetical protein GIB67_032741 [Kingdonia uniflora]
MTVILERRESESLWGRFCNWITSTENRLYIGWFGVLMIPTLLTATSVFIIAFIAAPPVDIDGIREPISGSLLYGNNIISGAIIPTSAAIVLADHIVLQRAICPLGFPTEEKDAIQIKLNYDDEDQLIYFYTGDKFHREGIINNSGKVHCLYLPDPNYALLGAFIYINIVYISKNVSIYDSKMNQVSLGTPMMGRGKATVPILFNGNIYLFGIRDDSAFNGLSVKVDTPWAVSFDPFMNSWSDLSAPDEITQHSGIRAKKRSDNVKDKIEISEVANKLPRILKPDNGISFSPLFGEAAVIDSITFYHCEGFICACDLATREYCPICNLELQLNHDLAMEEYWRICNYVFQLNCESEKMRVLVYGGDRKLCMIWSDYYSNANCPNWIHIHCLKLQIYKAPDVEGSSAFTLAKEDYNIFKVDDECLIDCFAVKDSEGSMKVHWEKMGDDARKKYAHRLLYQKELARLEQQKRDLKQQNHGCQRGIIHLGVKLLRIVFPRAFSELIVSLSFSAYHCYMLLFWFLIKHSI